MTNPPPGLYRGHLPPRELHRGAASLDTAQAGLLLHALACGRCAGILLATLRPRNGPEVPAPLPAIDFRPVWERAGSPQPTKEPPLFASLVGKSPDELRRELADLAAAEPWTTPWALLEAARLADDAADAEGLARVARELLSDVAEDLPPQAQLGDLRTLVLAEVAEACRLQRRLDEAMELLDQAAKSISPVPESEARAVYCRLLGRVRKDQGRTEEALGLYLRSGALSESMGRLDLQAAALVDLGTLQMDLYQYDDAAFAFGSAALLGPRGLAPAVVLRALEGLALAHTLADRVDQARHALAFARQHRAGLPASAESLELVRLGARLALEAGDLEEAGELLAEAFPGLCRLAAYQPAAVAGVEQAWLALLRRDARELAAVATELAALGEQLLPAPRAILTGFLAALAEDTATVELARATAHQLDHMPWYRVRPSGLKPVG